MEACEFLEWNCTDDIFGNKGNHESAAATMGDLSIFAVDDLLDFSNEEIAGYIGDGDTTDDGNHWPSCGSSPKTIITDSDSKHDSSNIAMPQSNSEQQQQQPHHLCVPEDDLGELEWLSNFVVEDSFSEQGSAATLIPPCFGSGSATPTTAEPVGCNSNNSTSSWVTSETDYCPSSTTSAKSSAIFNLEAPVPGRARSKRFRISARNISSRIIENKTSTHSHFYSSDLEFPLVKKKPAVLKPPVSPEQPLMAANVRKCRHCKTTKTPQWRTGPKGPKTLCNACGVRYKSGRLVPEYRPAASPTFVPSKHSNSHRKVMEMRRQKERRQQQQFAINGCHVVASLQFHSNDTEEDDHCNNSNTNFSGFSSSAWLGFAASSSSEYDDENTYLLPTKHDYRHLIL